MRCKRAVSLLMTLMMAFAVLSLTAAAAELPAEVTDLPAEAVPSPADEETDVDDGAIDPPAEEVDPPAEKVDLPAEEVDPPAEEVDLPAEEVDPPAEEVDPPAEEIYPPAEEVDPPAEEPVPSAEETYPLAEEPNPLTEETDLHVCATDSPDESCVSTATMLLPHYLRLSYDEDQGSIDLDPMGDPSDTEDNKFWYYYEWCGYPKVDITVTPHEGYVIKNIRSWKKVYGIWYLDEITIPNPEDIFTLENKEMKWDRKISVEFEKLYKATAMANPPEGGTATVNGGSCVTAVAGTEITFMAESNSDNGYYFSGWYEEDELLSENETYTISLDRDITLTAVFMMEEEVTHQVILEKIGEGAVTGEGTYDDGAEVTVAASPEEGYSFEGWYRYGEEDELIPVSEDNSYSFAIYEDTLLIAKFERITHEVTIDIIGKGTVTGAGIYKHGEYLDISATPDSGYRFVNWYLGGSSFSPVEYPVTTDMAITAEFVKTQKDDSGSGSGGGSGANQVTRYTLDVSVQGNGSVVPEGKHTYREGTTVVLVPSPNQGSIFIGWYGEDADDIIGNTILMDGDKSIIARFSSADKEFPPIENLAIEPEPEEEIVVILDQEIPLEAPSLPKTAGIPYEFFLTSGVFMITGGIAVRRKKRKH